MKRGFGPLVGILAISGLFIIGIMLLTSGGGGGKTPKPAKNAPKPLIDYAKTNATVSLTIKGAVNAREAHREIRVTVGKNSRELEIIKGYQNSVIKDKTYANDQAAYTEFLHAINYANFTRERGTDLKSEAGICPLGNRYVFALEQGDKEITRLWTSTCSGIGRGTFDGETALLLSLFEKQIPDYDKLTQRVDLR